MAVTSDNEAARNRRVAFWTALVLVVATAGAYWGVADCQFVELDDRDYVTENPNVRGGLTLDGVVWGFTHSHSCNWHPLTWMSHMVDVSIFGMHPSGHHLTNLAFHILATLLLFGFLRYATARPWPSFFAAALFALHPLHVESVAWVSERKDVLSAFFCFAALWMYARYVRKPAWAGYAAVVVLFAMGLMAKPMLVTLPFVLFLMDYWPLERFAIEGRRIRMNDGSGWRLALEKMPLVLLSCGSGVITFLAQTVARKQYDAVMLNTRLANAAVSCLRYIAMMVWPADLACLYPFGTRPLGAAAALSAVVVVAVTLAAFCIGRRYKYVLAGWLWYLVTLIPVAGIIQVGPQSHADRYTYIPLVGLFVAVVWAAAEAVGRSRLWQRAAAITGIAILALASVLTWRQVGYWRDTETLYSRAVAVTERNYALIGDLGMLSLKRGDIDRAEPLLRESLAGQAKNARALNALGMVMIRRGDADRAIGYFAAASQADPNLREPYLNMGLALVGMNRLREAEDSFRAAVKTDPKWSTARWELANLLTSTGRVDEAIANYRASVSLDPSPAGVHFSLGMALAAKGAYDEAAAAYRAGLRITTDYDALMGLVSCLKSAGKAAEAEQVFREARELRHGADK